MIKDHGSREKIIYQGENDIVSLVDAKEMCEKYLDGRVEDEEGRNLLEETVKNLDKITLYIRNYTHRLYQTPELNRGEEK